MGGRGALSESCVGQNGWVDEEMGGGNSCFDKKVVDGFIYMLEEK